MPGFNLMRGDLCFIITGVFLSSWTLGFMVLSWLRRLQILDQPNHRSSHAVPTPRGGGLGIILVVAGGGVWLSMRSAGLIVPILLGAVVGLAVVSFVDDRFSLSWRIRMAGQLLASLAVALALIMAMDYNWWLCLSLPVLLLWLVGYANAFNFMDGINGMAGMQAMSVGFGTAFVAMAGGVPREHSAVLFALVVAAAAAGFLPHNFPRARMFMGDVGSIPLGFTLAALTVWLVFAHSFYLLLPLLSLHVNFFLDTGITLFRRWRAGAILHEAHREHFYQRLVRAGWSHARVTGTEALLQVAVVLGAVASVSQGALVQILAIAVTVLLWLLFFGFCEYEFRSHLRRPI